MLSRGAWAKIDLAALKQNYIAIKSCIQGRAQLCAVVKANGYGHGALAVARTAVECGAAYLAVATLEEAKELRRAGFTTPILLLGVVPPEYAPEIVAHELTAAVTDKDSAVALSQAATLQGRRVKIHLKVDTGMGRIGIPPREAGNFAAFLGNLPGLDLEGIFSHFAAADTADKTHTRRQLELFKEAIAAVEGQGISLRLKHIAESAAILEIPEAHFDMVRAGIIQYGLWPSSEVSHPIDLKPVMTLMAQIALVKEVAVGETIGYGGEFKAARASRIATLPIGYADGYIRAYGQKGYVEIRGKRAPIAGRVCMDQVMVDVTDIPEAKSGDVATLFGSPTLTTDEAAGWLNTINYEVTCLVSPRVPRLYQ
ncbi:MAG: alanine racemase [Selenomonadaceae bacterium]|nr:alanine racemase [Selenomonadaceae bacterium]